jgi:hypothetical protein
MRPCRPSSNGLRWSRDKRRGLRAPTSHESLGWVENRKSSARAKVFRFAFDSGRNRACRRSIEGRQRTLGSSLASGSALGGQQCSRRATIANIFRANPVIGFDGRARAQASPYSWRAQTSIDRATAWWPRSLMGAPWGRTDRPRGIAVGRTAWRAEPLRRRSSSPRTSRPRMKPGRASGPLDRSGASPPPRRSPASP